MGLFLWLLFGCVDKCADKNCQEGDCQEGVCICPDGSRGEYCLNGKAQYDSAKVIGITVRKFPLNNNGTDWDLLVNTKPDVRIGINLNREVTYNSPVWMEAEGQKYFETNFKIAVDTTNVAIYFSDMDEGNNFESMCALYFVALDFHHNNYPKSYIIRDSKGRAEVEFLLEYE